LGNYVLTLESLRKPILVHDQEWYRTAICIDCPEFKFIPLPEGCAGFCVRVEEDKPCIFTNPETSDGEESDASILLEIENMLITQTD
jgi:hypothetical protein